MSADRHSRLVRAVSDLTWSPARQALIQVVEHHKPTGVNGDYCNGCDLGLYAETPADSPCSTVELIERALGVTS